MSLAARLAVFVIAVASCEYVGLGYTPIGDIEKSPAAYEGKDVRVKGTVVDVLKLPLVETKVYMLRDGSGQILVRGTGTVPAMNSTVRVRGVVSSVAIVGGQSVGPHLKESERW